MSKKKSKKPITLEAIANKIDQRHEEMALMVARGFERVYTDLDEVKNDLGKKLDQLDERVRIVETKLDKALYTEITHIESRLRKVEEKVGIKPAHA